MENKNKKNVYIHINGDVYAKYDISAQTLPKDARVVGELVVLKPEDFSDEMKEYTFSLLTGRHPIVKEDGTVDNRRQTTYTNGEKTLYGVLSVTAELAGFLEDIADQVWSRIDQRCGAKVPSRLYRNTAYVCAYALTHLGISAKVVKMPLNPEKYNGLKNQYRVVVNTQVPEYPWEREQISGDELNKRFKVVSKYEQVSFDFDATYGLLADWCWPDGKHIGGADARELRDGRPTRWVGSILKVNSTGTIRPHVLHSDGYDDDFEVLFKRTSLLSVLAETTDLTMESMMGAVRTMFGGFTHVGSAKPATSDVTPMSLG